MPSLARRDAVRVRELVSSLSTVGDGGPVLEAVVPAFRQLVDAEKALAFGLVRRGMGFAVDFAVTDGMPPGMFQPVFDQWLEDKLVDWANFNPVRPEARQRNVALTIDMIGKVAKRDPRTAPVMTELLPVCGLDKSDAVRALVCEGPLLLAWFGAHREAPFTSRETRILSALVPALKNRLKLDRTLGASSLNEAAFVAALEAVPAAAYLVDARAVIRHANTAGRVMLDRDRASIVGQLRASLGEPGLLAPFTLVRLAAAGLPEHYLAMLVTAPEDPSARVEIAADRWKLTPRQREVLLCMARGLSNKAIAATLGCAENTVELHVSAILEKAGAKSRSVLVARFWTSL